MKTFFRWGLLVLLPICLNIQSVTAQIQWTPDQKAVWQTETSITDLLVKGDWQTAATYYDDSYQGWPISSPIPIPKSELVDEVSYRMSQGGKYIFWNIVPIIIWVKGDYAYTDYYYQSIWQDKEGKKTTNHGKWLDVLMKKNGKWLLVGDHGGADMHPPRE
ncbi:MAG: YybH family protein [Chitinophagaceae bacterium]